MIRLAVFVAAATIAPTVLASEFTAKPRHIIDGDTYSISLRAAGVDAPEARQQCRNAKARCYPCGKVAHGALVAASSTAETLGDALENPGDRRGNVAFGKLTFKVWGIGRYGRPIVTMYRGGRDMHLMLVKQGWLLVYPVLLYEPLLAPYLAAEAEARTAKRGMWQGAFVAPWKWRGGERLAGCE